MINARNYTSILRRLASLYLESGRLALTEKLTIILGAMAVGFVALAIGVIVLFFISLALASQLEVVMYPVWAYLIVAGGYLVILAILVACRKSLFINPISRFLSRTLLSPEKSNPKTEGQDDEN